MNKFIILIILLTSAANAENFVCTKGAISQIKYSEKIEEQSTFCYNNKKTNLLSQNCVSKKCMAFDSQQKYDIQTLMSPIGKPGFKLCRELGGRPELINFYVDRIPYKLDRCLFADGSFVDTDYLLSHYLNRDRFN